MGDTGTVREVDNEKKESVEKSNCGAGVSMNRILQRREERLTWELGSCKAHVKYFSSSHW